MQDKSKESIKLKYGDNITNVFQLDFVKDKIRKTKLKRYGNEYYSNHDKTLKTIKERYGVNNISQIDFVKDKVMNTCMKRYGVSYSCLINVSKSNGPISSINKKFSKLLENNKINYEFEYNINKYSYDIHILNTNILIELNPTYTHNSSINNRYGKCLNEFYHYNKTKFAIDNGYQIINIFDWTNWNDVILMIKNNNIPKYKLINRKNFYNIKTKDRIIGDNTKDEEKLINKGYVIIYDVI